MMFDWLGERHDDEVATNVANRIDTAVREVLISGEFLTADLGGKASTTEVTSAVINRL